MRIAVVGGGVSGLVAARELARRHEVTLYESEPRLGGHTCTVDVELAGRRYAVDTGFIVFNERTYPGLVALFRELGVAWQDSEMSFSVRDERADLEYNGTSLNALFAQRSNLLRPGFWRMVRDILRFYREAPELLEGDQDEVTLLDWLERRRYSREFVELHMVPMAAAVWSASAAAMRRFPARFLVQFFHNHGFLQVEGRPQWLVVRGGSRAYLEPLAASFRDGLRVGTAVRSVRRAGGDVLVRLANGDTERYERVVLATHADTTRRLLLDPTEPEREVLGAFGYQRNETLLHTDARLLPRRPLARASWNYNLPAGERELATVSYWMNRLQGLDAPEELVVTLNQGGRVDPSKVLWRKTWSHPIYTPEAVRAQARHAEIDGARNVHFAGAYWRYGFHEDGLQSALAACRNLREVAVV